MFLPARDLRATFIARPIRREQRNYEQEDEDGFVGFKIHGDGTNECHVGVK